MFKHAEFDHSGAEAPFSGGVADAVHADAIPATAGAGISAAPALASGSHSLTAANLDYASSFVDDGAPSDFSPMVQRRASAAGPPADQVHAAAERGVATPSEALPHAAAIQASFGPDIGAQIATVEAHVGGEAAGACNDMGAQAFATGHHVAFESEPDLHTAAHEAAHVVQQAQGVNLYGGVGDAGDAYEAHADAVADRVVAGESAAHLFGHGHGLAPRAEAGPVQRKESHHAPDAAGKRGESHKTAQSRSGDVIEMDLKIAAKKLSESVPALTAAAAQVKFYDDQVEEARDEYQRAKKKVKHYAQMESDADGDIYALADARTQKRRWEHKRDDLATEVLRTAEPKYHAIAKVRDAVLRKALSSTEHELVAILQKAKGLNLGADEVTIDQGAGYVSHVMRQVRELTAALEMAGNQTDPLTGGPAFNGLEQKPLGELAAAEKILEDIRATFHLHEVSASSLDIEADMAKLESDSVGANLDAAEAQAKLAQQALDAWHAIGKGKGPAEGQYDELSSSVSAIETHLSDAQQGLEKMDAPAKKKFKARLASLQKEVQKVHVKASSRLGGAPASVRGTADFLPDMLASLQRVIVASGAAHGSAGGQHATK